MSATGLIKLVGHLPNDLVADPNARLVSDNPSKSPKSALAVISL